ncbi:MAG: type IV toxin-antitoxin system AbiEi family antitoxin domain-containing protein [Rhodoferax sp.]|nr:type IV toxin-antitoxin system AbiEi family antitoxin domain-containing protein [Aquabacterium sp.]MBP9906879.1 type IV toxin-antitoxin system AbiEi family antitoxin domain-containing protein [Rhodoferax sp.]
MNPNNQPSQRNRALSHLQAAGMSRLSELTAKGITAATVSRLEREGAIVRLARGLYQLADAPLDANHTLAEASKLVPKGVICLTSSLAFHDLTDQIPAQVWMAIGSKDWHPTFAYPPVRFARFSGQRLLQGVESHVIDGVSVPIFGVSKTIADLFRYRQTVGINVALEGLREALRQKKASPADIAREAVDAKVWKIMAPYMSALTSHG